MSKLEWDKQGERLFETGVSNCALYVYDSASKNYGDGVAWNGITSISESPEGAEPTDLWADNTKYAVLRSAETFGGTIEAYMYPDEFCACDGSAIVSSVKGVYFGQQSRKAFGLAYKTQVGSDTEPDASTNYKLHIIFNATASPSEKTYDTINDSPDAITFSWEFDTTTVPTGIPDIKPVSTMVIDTTKLDNGAENANLKSLEKILFGDTNSAPTLPSPSEILTTMGWTGSTQD